MSEVIELLVSWTVTTALSFAVVILDERRSSEQRLERAWPPSSRNAALVAFGILAVPLHFIRTRGGFGTIHGLRDKLIGLVLGVVALTAVVIVAMLVVEGVALVLGLKTE